jgi:catalase
MTSNNSDVGYRTKDAGAERERHAGQAMTPAQQQVLFENTARALGDARAEVKQRHIDNCTKADPAYGAGVAAAVAKLG